MFKIIFISICIVQVYANDYLVVANKSLHIDKITALQLKMIFLKKSKIINGTTVVPINLGVSNIIRKSFEKNILHMSRKRLKYFWIEQHYLGKRPPITMKSPKSIIKFVQKIDGAISYIPINDLNDNVKVIFRWTD